MARLTIRIDFEGSESFGPGKVRLLELIDAHGSIRSAASAMNMSYRHAWLLLQAVEDTFGAPVISTATGGAKGGGAKLTEFGRSPGFEIPGDREPGRQGDRRRAVGAPAGTSRRYSG